MNKTLKQFAWFCALFFLTLAAIVQPARITAQNQDQQYPDQGQDQDQQDDPPSRVARLGYMEGSVSMQPGGEDEWVQAVPNRPFTTGDKLWTDRNSRAELQLGSATVRLDANTGFSFLNFDDDTIQIQLTSGSINIRVRQLDQNDAFEIDTPNLAFSLYQPGSYRVEASEDGNYTVVSIRDGDGEATGNGQTYKLHEGQRATFSGSDSLNADVEQIGGRDQFDNWAYERDRRWEDSRSAKYCAPDVVGYQDLDDYGDWRDDPGYGHVWYPNRVAADWAPYHDGHWVWIAPWGYTWVDDSPWGYAPFHYGRWVTVGGRWGWIAGPVAVRPVYAPALVVFIGGGPGGFGGNVGWFPLGPREVYVPSYRVSRGYVNRVNVSNTTVNVTQVTNVYNTTIINKTTNVTNVTYVNRGVRGAVTAVPQRTFTGAQPVARAAVRVDEREIARASVSSRVAVAPTRDSVLGARASTANRVAAPPAAVANRQVIAKKTPPPPPVAFARQQQALEAHPGQALGRREVQNLRPAAAADAHPQVRQAPPGRAATPNMGRPGNQPGNQPGNPNAGRPGQPGNGQPANGAAGNQPNNAARPGQPNGVAPNNTPNNPSNNQPNQPNNNAARPGQPGSTPPNRPNNRPDNQPGTPGANDRPNNDRPGNDRPNNDRPNNDRPGANAPGQANRPFTPPDRPNNNQPNNRPDNQPNNRPGNRPDNQPDNRPDRPAAQPNNRPGVNQPGVNQPGNQPDVNRPQPNRPPVNQPDNRPNNRPETTAPRPNQAEPNNRPDNNRPDNNRPPAQNNNRPNSPDNRPDNRMQTNRPVDREDRPAAQPNNSQPNNRPQPNQPAPRPQAQPPNNRPERTPPSANKPAPKEQPKPKTPEEKKREQEEQKPH